MSDAPSRPRYQIRRRKRPPQWRQINFPRRGIPRLHPAARRPVRQRARDLWERVRLIIRSSTLWLLVAVWMFTRGYYAIAAPALFVSLVFFLFRPYIHEFELHVEEDFGANSAEFLSTMAGATGVPMIAGNRLHIFNNGEQFYPPMLEAIRNAQFSVTMEQYIFASSEIGLQFAHAFAASARRGVSVKLLLDAVGGASFGNDLLAIVTDAGCEVRWYHPIRWYNLHRVNNRNHRKSIVVDGRLAFTGGAGIDDHWLGNARNPAEWRDIQVKMEGPGVAQLQTGFAFNWLQTTGEVITGPIYYPVLDHAGRVDLQTILSSPRGDRYTASILYSLAILSARSCVYMANPYFVPGPRTVEMLADAVVRGVDVKVMVAGAHNDMWWARQNSVRLYGRLLEAGVEIYEYQPTMLHQKTMVVDHIWATIGTTNLDQRSFQFNEEVNVCFYDPDSVDQLRRTFFTDLESCRRVTLEEWRSRSPWRRVGERFASLLQDQV